MPTHLQLKLVHVAARRVGLNDAQYRTLLFNAAGVESAKALSQAAYEDVMAVLEGLGFRDNHKGPTYWRDKVAGRGREADARVLHKIRELAGRSVYPLDRLAWRFSGGRTSDVGRLTPREAWMLVEMLKGSNARAEAGAGGQTQGSLFGA